MAPLELVQVVEHLSELWWGMWDPTDLVRAANRHAQWVECAMLDEIGFRWYAPPDSNRDGSRWELDTGSTSFLDILIAQFEGEALQDTFGVVHLRYFQLVLDMDDGEVHWRERSVKVFRGDGEPPCPGRKFPHQQGHRWEPYLPYALYLEDPDIGKHEVNTCAHCGLIQRKPTWLAKTAPEGWPFMDEAFYSEKADLDYSTVT